MKYLLIIVLALGLPLHAALDNRDLPTRSSSTSLVTVIKQYEERATISWDSFFEQLVASLDQLTQQVPQDSRVTIATLVAKIRECNEAIEKSFLKNITLLKKFEQSSFICALADALMKCSAFTALMGMPEVKACMGADYEELRYYFATFTDHTAHNYSKSRPADKPGMPIRFKKLRARRLSKPLPIPVHRADGLTKSTFATHSNVQIKMPQASPAEFSAGIRAQVFPVIGYSTPSLFAPTVAAIAPSRPGSAFRAVTPDREQSPLQGASEQTKVNAQTASPESLLLATSQLIAAYRGESVLSTPGLNSNATQAHQEADTTTQTQLRKRQAEVQAGESAKRLKLDETLAAKKIAANRLASIIKTRSKICLITQESFQLFYQSVLAMPFLTTENIADINSFLEKNYLLLSEDIWRFFAYDFACLDANDCQLLLDTLSNEIAQLMEFLPQAIAVCKQNIQERNAQHTIY